MTSTISRFSDEDFLVLGAEPSPLRKFFADWRWARPRMPLAVEFVDAGPVVADGLVGEYETVDGVSIRAGSALTACQG